MSSFSESILSTYDSEPTYYPPVELPYPEWRLALADRAQKAGLGPLGDGTVMEWLMLAEDAEEPNSILVSGCGQPISGASFSTEHQTAEGSSAAYRRRAQLARSLDPCDPVTYYLLADMLAPRVSQFSMLI